MITKSKEARSHGLFRLRIGKTVVFGGCILSGLLLTSCGADNTSAAGQSADHIADNIQYAFTHKAGEHPDKLLEHVMDQADHTLDIAIYSLTNYDIVDSIRDAAKRGVKVRVITDSEESKNAAEAKELKYLQSYHIPIKINHHRGLMHLKVTIADRSVFTTGSFNYSYSAAHDNNEVLMVMKDRQLAEQWDDYFNQLWNDQARFVKY